MARPPRILLVEDDHDVRELFTEYLRGRGHVVTDVGSVADARAALVHTPPDLVLTDLRLDDGDGTRLVEAAALLSPRVPTIVVAGTGSVEGVITALRAGAADVLVKPLRLRDLHATIERVLADGAKAREQARSAAAAELYVALELAETVDDVDVHVGRICAWLRHGGASVDLADAGDGPIVTGPNGRVYPVGARRLAVVDPDLPEALPLLLALHRAYTRVGA